MMTSPWRCKRCPRPVLGLMMTPKSHHASAIFLVVIRNNVQTSDRIAGDIVVELEPDQREDVSFFFRLACARRRNGVSRSNTQEVIVSDRIPGMYRRGLGAIQESFF